MSKLSYVVDTRERDLIPLLYPWPTRTIPVGDIWIGLSGEDVTVGGIVAGILASVDYRLFERWAGQGLGGGPASSRLTSFVGGDGAQAGGYANAGTNGYGANSAYNGFPEADGSINHEPPHMPLGRGARRLMH